MRQGSDPPPPSVTIHNWVSNWPHFTNYYPPPPPVLLPPEEEPPERKRRRRLRPFVVGGALLALVANIDGAVEFWQNHAEPRLNPPAAAQTATNPVIDLTPPASASTPDGPRPPLPAEAEAAADEYFDMALRDDIDSMWASLSSNFKTNSGTTWDDLDLWWGDEVRGIEYVISPSAEPIVDEAGGIWVQWAARFEHAPGFKEVGWDDKYEISSYRFVSEGGKLVIDDSEKYSVECPAADLEECSLDWHYRHGE